MTEKNPSEELSVEGVDYILTNDLKEFDKSQIINPEHPIPKKKEAEGENDAGSPWRLVG